MKTGCKKQICFNKNCKNNILSKRLNFLIHFFSYLHVCEWLSTTQALHRSNLGGLCPRISDLPRSDGRLKQRPIYFWFPNGELRVVLLLVPTKPLPGIANQRSKLILEELTFREINSHPDWRWYAYHVVEGGWKRKWTKGIHADCLELNIRYRGGAIITGRPRQGGYVRPRIIHALADRTFELASLDRYFILNNSLAK